MTRDEVNKSDNAESFILFELAGASYAVASRVVQHIEMIEDNITAVPNAHSAVEGVVFSRGQVIPAISLRARFGFEKTPHDLRSRLIVAGVGNRPVGFIVDSAREFITISKEMIQPPAETITGLSGKYLEGIATVGERIILILDLNAVVDPADTIAPSVAGA